jgi:hypothetical protein
MGKSAKILRSALLSENAKVGLSNSRLDTEGENGRASREYPEATGECNDGIGSRWIFDAKSY